MNKKKEKEMICPLHSRPGMCFEKTDKVLHAMAGAEIVSRVSQKCALIDAAFVRQGLGAGMTKALKAEMNVYHKVCRNAAVCLQLEDIIDLSLDAIKQGVPAKKIIAAMEGLIENKPTKK